MTHRDLRWAVAYQVVAWSALLAIQWVDPSTAGLAALLHALPPAVGDGADPVGRRSAPWSIVTAFSLVRWAQLDFSGDSLTEILISGIISMGLSLSLGLFINRIVGEAESRAQTIDELRATQARLAAAERDRGVHEERERISREIHDTLAQGFTSVVALSRAAQAALARGDTGSGAGAARAHRAHGIRQPRRGPADRRRAHARAPAVAHPRGGPRAARRGGDQRDRAARPTCGWPANPVPLGGSAEVVILRTAQEALSNVRRHASAARVDLTLAYDDPDEVVLTVHDDGLGFDLDGARSGFGLDGVQARAAEVGGAVRGAQRAGHRHDAAPGGAAVIRLLVVDDHPVVRAGMVAVLGEESDFEVVGEAANGAEALGLVPRLRPDVVLMDLRMPVMDGAEATARITAEAGRAAGAGAHHLRHGCRHRAGRGGGRARLPAQGRPDRGAGRRDPAGGPRARRCWPRRWRPGWPTGCGHPRGPSSPGARSRCCGLVARGLSNADIGRSCSSARRRSRRT